jgi:hypothetical protein
MRLLDKDPSVPAAYTGKLVTVQPDPAAAAVSHSQGNGRAVPSAALSIFLSCYVVSHTDHISTPDFMSGQLQQMDAAVQNLPCSVSCTISFLAPQAFAMKPAHAQSFCCHASSITGLELEHYASFRNAPWQGGRAAYAAMSRAICRRPSSSSRAAAEHKQRRREYLLLLGVGSSLPSASQILVACVWCILS